MSSYTNAKDWCTPIGGILYKSTKPLTWEVGTKGSGLYVTVPVDTTFDVSIPKGLRWLFDPHNPKYLKAAALHDMLLLQNWARTTAGAEFHEALKSDGVTLWKRLAMWLAVSLFKYR